METIHSYCNTLSELFQQVISNSNSPKQDLINSIFKIGDEVSALFKKSPEYSRDEYVIEILEIYSGVCRNEFPKIYDICSNFINICLNSLPKSELKRMWETSNDICLCLYISDITSLDNDVFCKKISYFIENPQIEKYWFKKFIEMIRKPSVDEFKIDDIIPFNVYIVDESPLRSTLGYLFLNSFEKINSISALTIASSWLCLKHKTPHAANHCRLILKKAPSNTLNLIATLTFDFPILLSIIPPNVNGFKTLVLMTIHRIKTFYPDELSHFLELCDIRVREITQKENTKISPELRIYDATFLNNISKEQIKELFHPKENIDFYTAAFLFARYTSIPNASQSIDYEAATKIREMILNSPETTAAYVPNSKLDISDIASIREMIEQNQISHLLKLIQNRIT